MIKISDFPKAEKKLQEFILKSLQAFQKNVMKDAPIEILEVPEIEEGWVKRMSENYVETHRRNLLDFFDENEIFITIDMFQGKFRANIIGSLYKSKDYDTRTEVEIDIIGEAFKVLEEKL